MPLTVGGGIRGFTDADGRRHSALDVAAEYFRSGADKARRAPRRAARASPYHNPTPCAGRRAASLHSVCFAPCKPAQQRHADRQCSALSAVAARVPLGAGEGPCGAVVHAAGSCRAVHQARRPARGAPTGAAAVSAGRRAQVSIGTEAVDAAEAYLRSGERTGESAIEQISWVRARLRARRRAALAAAPGRLHWPHGAHATPHAGSHHHCVTAHHVQACIRQQGSSVCTRTALWCLEHSWRGAFAEAGAAGSAAAFQAGWRRRCRHATRPTGAPGARAGVRRAGGGRLHRPAPRLGRGPGRHAAAGHRHRRHWPARRGVLLVAGAARAAAARAVAGRPAASRHPMPRRRVAVPSLSPNPTRLHMWAIV